MGGEFGRLERTVYIREVGRSSRRASEAATVHLLSIDLQRIIQNRPIQPPANLVQWTRRE